MSDYHARTPARDQRDPQAMSLRSRSSSRDMGWRKPVPKFIPSPPISPSQTLLPHYADSPAATTFGFTMDRANPFSMSLTSLNGDLPPLPADWRENIDRATRNGSSTNLKSLRTPPITPIITSPTPGFAHGYYHTAASSQLQIHETDKDQSMFQEVDLGAMSMKSRDRHHLADKENLPPPSFNQGLKRLGVSYHTNGSNASLCRIPKSYRPPTPPLPSRKRTSAPGTPITVTMNKPMHIIYPDLTGLGAEAHSQRTKSPDSDDTIDTHTLRTVHSSLTTWNAAPLDTSTLADDDDKTLPVYQPHSVRKSTIGSKTMLVVEPHHPEPGFWDAFGLLFDSFLNPLKSCLSGV